MVRDVLLALALMLACVAAQTDGTIADEVAVMSEVASIANSGGLRGLDITAGVHVGSHVYFSLQSGVSWGRLSGTEQTVTSLTMQGNDLDEYYLRGMTRLEFTSDNLRALTASSFGHIVTYQRLSSGDLLATRLYDLANNVTGVGVGRALSALSLADNDIDFYGITSQNQTVLHFRRDLLNDEITFIDEYPAYTRDVVGSLYTSRETVLLAPNGKYLYSSMLQADTNDQSAETVLISDVVIQLWIRNQSDGTLTAGDVYTFNTTATRESEIATAFPAYRMYLLIPPDSLNLYWGDHTMLGLREWRIQDNGTLTDMYHHNPEPERPSGIPGYDVPVQFYGAAKLVTQLGAPSVEFVYQPLVSVALEGGTPVEADWFNVMTRTAGAVPSLTQTSMVLVLGQRNVGCSLFNLVVADALYCTNFGSAFFPSAAELKIGVWPVRPLSPSLESRLSTGQGSKFDKKLLHGASSAVYSAYSNRLYVSSMLQPYVTIVDVEESERTGRVTLTLDGGVGIDVFLNSDDLLDILALNDVESLSPLAGQSLWNFNTELAITSDGRWLYISGANPKLLPDSVIAHYRIDQNNKTPQLVSQVLPQDGEFGDGVLDWRMSPDDTKILATTEADYVEFTPTNETLCIEPFHVNVFLLTGSTKVPVLTSRVSSTELGRRSMGSICYPDAYDCDLTPSRCHCTTKSRLQYGVPKDTSTGLCPSGYTAGRTFTLHTSVWSRDGSLVLVAFEANDNTYALTTDYPYGIIAIPVTEAGILDVDGMREIVHRSPLPAELTPRMAVTYSSFLNQVVAHHPTRAICIGSDNSVYSISYSSVRHYTLDPTSGQLTLRKVYPSDYLLGYLTVMNAASGSRYRSSFGCSLSADERYLYSAGGGGSVPEPGHVVVYERVEFGELVLVQVMLDGEEIVGVPQPNSIRRTFINGKDTLMMTSLSNNGLSLLRYTSSGGQPGNLLVVLAAVFGSVLFSAALILYLMVQSRRRAGEPIKWPWSKPESDEKLEVLRTYRTSTDSMRAVGKQDVLASSDKRSSLVVNVATDLGKDRANEFAPRQPDSNAGPTPAIFTGLEAEKKKKDRRSSGKKSAASAGKADSERRRSGAKTSSAAATAVAGSAGRRKRGNSAGRKPRQGSAGRRGTDSSAGRRGTDSSAGRRASGKQSSAGRRASGKQDSAGRRASGKQDSAGRRASGKQDSAGRRASGGKNRASSAAGAAGAGSGGRRSTGRRNLRKKQDTAGAGKDA